MYKRKIYFFSSLIITLSTIIIFATGSSLLTLAINNSNTIPLGTFITWVGLISLPMSIFWGIQELRKPTTNFNKFLSSFLKLIILLAILWVPISYLLAGNLSFNFSEKTVFQGGQTAMKCFWFLTYGISIGALSTICLYWISLLFKK
ncbi:hypothetical protein [Algibacter aquimarinus]|uniref:hypothetical protein n=1 Tax=Algibacter aquimarinus TaxID=1136748 RepID=UPI0031E7952E